MQRKYVLRGQGLEPSPLFDEDSDGAAECGNLLVRGCAFGIGVGRRELEREKCTALLAKMGCSSSLTLSSRNKYPGYLGRINSTFTPHCFGCTL